MTSDGDKVAAAILAAASAGQRIDKRPGLFNPDEPSSIRDHFVREYQMILGMIGGGQAR